MAEAEINAIDGRIEVLVAAYDRLVLKLVYDGAACHRCGGRHACHRRRRCKWPTAVDPAFIVVVDGDDDTPAGHADPATRASTTPQQLLLPAPPR